MMGHSLWIMSPQREGFVEKEVGLKRERVFVEGKAPLKSLLETSKFFKYVWLRGGKRTSEVIKAKVKRNEIVKTN
jgi:hypothetical protein